MANIPHLHPIHSTNSKNSTRPECRPKKDIMQNTVVEMNKAALPKALIWPEEGGQSQPAPSDLQVCLCGFMSLKVQFFNRLLKHFPLTSANKG